jgi:hypothetical protein
VGKTTSAINLGACLAEAGKKYSWSTSIPKRIVPPGWASRTVHAASMRSWSAARRGRRDQKTPVEGLFWRHRPSISRSYGRASGNGGPQRISRPPCPPWPPATITSSSTARPPWHPHPERPGRGRRGLRAPPVRILRPGRAVAHPPDHLHGAEGLNPRLAVGASSSPCTIPVRAWPKTWSSRFPAISRTASSAPSSLATCGLSEAPSHGLPICRYDAECVGAKSYRKLAEEVSSVAKHGLGRGLGALIPDGIQGSRRWAPVPAPPHSASWPLSAKSRQPRKDFSEESLKELADSIKEHGVIQPILVEEDSPAATIIVAGSGDGARPAWRASGKCPSWCVPSPTSKGSRSPSSRTSSART